MLISIPIKYSIVNTNVIDPHPIYDPANTYKDKEVVQHDLYGGKDYKLYGIFTNDKVVTAAPHHSFVPYSETAPNAIKDEKNYSKAISSGTMLYTIISEGTFDTVGLGSTNGDVVSMTFRDPQGNIEFEIDKNKIQNQLDNTGKHGAFNTSKILYCPTAMVYGSTVEIVLEKTVGEIELGTVELGLSIEAGFTHLVFQNTYKDFSPTETDQWGNVTYIPGAKINIHKGTVDLPISNYDYMNRIMIAIGGKIVMINGYGVKRNDEPDNSAGHFASTMIIGRMKVFSLTTNIKDKRMLDYATYKITVEEIVSWGAIALFSLASSISALGYVV